MAVPSMSKSLLSHISNISNDEPTTTMTLPLHTGKQKKLRKV